MNSFESFGDILILTAEEYYKNSCAAPSDQHFWDICDTAVLKKHLREVYMRTLIEEINLQKENLRGKTPEEEYEDYICRYLESEGYIKKLYKRYPLMVKELFRCIEYYTVNLTQLVCCLKNDIAELAKTFGVKDDIGQIETITPLSSDSHDKHKFIAEIKWKGGQKIIYKPHTLQNEYLYYKLQNILSRLNGLSEYDLGLLNRDTYGWMGYIRQKACRDENEVREYYYRYGIMLFGVYLLSSSDLHYENLIASGSFPVLIDLEAAADMHESVYDKDSAGETLRAKLRCSLYNSGLLPLFAFNRNGQGMNVSAINGKGGQLLPVKLPVIKNGCRSDIYIDYEYGRSPQGKNLVYLNEDAVDPFLYIDEIKAGFSGAYESFKQYKETVKSLISKEIKGIRNRYLVRNTQEYSMILSLSYHPRFLKDEEERKAVVRQLLKGDQKETDEKIIESEIKSILNGDIPSFYAIGDSRDLYSSGELICGGYFEKSPFEKVCGHIEKLTDEDISFQLDIIEATMTACRTEPSDVIDENFDTESYLKCVVELVKDQAVYNVDKTDVTWLSNLNADYGERKLLFEPMDDYLYSGKMGVLLFLKVYLREHTDAEASVIVEMLENYYFSYTDKKIAEETSEHKPIGAFTGEGSIVYGYEILYRMTEDEKYLLYAEKHAEYLIKLLKADKEYDLLGGNAGAIAALVNLYQLTDKKRYLEAAEQAFDCLKTNIVKFDKNRMGVVNSFAGQPLAGVAHGCSGYMLALTKLAFYSERKEEIDRYVQGFFDYESALYDESIKDWKDLRCPEGDTSEDLAWCHGKAGIMYIYNHIAKYGKDQFLESVLKDHGKPEIIPKIKNEDGLCHGNMGLYAMYHAKSDTIEISQKTGNFAGLHHLRKTESLSFMTGCTGVGYYLLKDKYNLPDVMSVEV